MAVINGAFAQDKTGNDVIQVTWATMLNGDTGAPLRYHDFFDRTVQLIGTLGVGGTMVWEGTNDPAGAANFVTLPDQQGVAMSFAALGIKQTSATPTWVRPRISAGDGTTSLTVILNARRFRSGDAV
jgi:hypothetical protein